MKKRYTKEDLYRVQLALLTVKLQNELEQQRSNCGDSCDNCNCVPNKTSSPLSHKTTIIQVHLSFKGYLYAMFVLLKKFLTNKKGDYIISIGNV